HRSHVILRPSILRGCETLMSPGEDGPNPALGKQRTYPINSLACSSERLRKATASTTRSANQLPRDATQKFVILTLAPRRGGYVRIESRTAMADVRLARPQCLRLLTTLCAE